MYGGPTLNRPQGIDWPGLPAPPTPPKPPRGTSPEFMKKIQKFRKPLGIRKFWRETRFCTIFFFTFLKGLTPASGGLDMSWNWGSYDVVLNRVANNWVAWLSVMTEIMSPVKNLACQTPSEKNLKKKFVKKFSWNFGIFFFFFVKFVMLNVC